VAFDLTISMVQFSNASLIDRGRNQIDNAGSFKLVDGTS
jgi:hypothetical protein